jgi:hypothetical protein
VGFPQALAGTKFADGTSTDTLSGAVSLNGWVGAKVAVSFRTEATRLAVAANPAVAKDAVNAWNALDGRKGRPVAGSAADGNKATEWRRTPVFRGAVPGTASESATDIDAAKRLDADATVPPGNLEGSKTLLTLASTLSDNKALGASAVSIRPIERESRSVGWPAAVES